MNYQEVGMHVSKMPEAPQAFDPKAVRTELTAVLQDHIPSHAPKEEQRKMLQEADREWQCLMQRQFDNIR